MSIFRKKLDLDMLRAIIIDDEPHMRQTIRKMLGMYCPNVGIVAEAGGVATGVDAIREHQPNLIFLDIKMDDGTGFDLLDQLRPIDFKVIFITAWDQYAIRAFRFSALDYLLKPLDPDDLVNAVAKAGQSEQENFNIQLENLNEHLNTQDQSQRKIIIRTLESIFLVPVKDIVFCESASNYTSVHLAGGRKIMVSSTIKEYEDMLDEYGFFRVHKSYLINMKHISGFEKAEGGYVVLENETKIPVASRKKDLLLEMFDRLAQI
jgi:two-component system LytT family response regulator